MARAALIALCIVALASPAWAVVYKYVDASGTITLTDVKTSSPETSGHVLARIYRPKPANTYTPPEKYVYPESDSYSPSARSERYRTMIDDHANRHGLDPRLLEAVIKTESNFNQRAVSSKGAQGLMQLMPQTASLMGVDNPFDADQNISGGARYLHEMLDRFNGNLTLALAAYNAGPLNVEKYGCVPPFAETQNYVKRIYSMYKGERNVHGSATASTSPSYSKAASAAPAKAKKETVYKLILADGTILYTNSGYTGGAGNAAR